ncbi:MAG: hypothetical protein K0R24_703 [Gammaproteobacteria bacterium]|jgi:hypothetical protein|nr:hypothetical protein [Gammaproteobacteria bacterium]
MYIHNIALTLLTREFKANTSSRTKTLVDGYNIDVENICS